MINIRTEKVIHCSDWDKLVIDTYNKPYTFQQQDGCQSRGRVYLNISKEEIEDNAPKSILFEINGDEMEINFKTWLNTSEEDINKKFPEKDQFLNNLFWDRNFYPNLQVIANDLCRKGLIEEGNYTINIDW